MTDFITLGIGPGGDIAHFIRVGLGASTLYTGTTAECRTYTPPAEDRTYTPPAEDRTLVVRCP